MLELEPLVGKEGLNVAALQALSCLCSCQVQELLLMFDRLLMSFLSGKAGSVSKDVNPGASVIYKWGNYFGTCTSWPGLCRNSHPGCRAEQLIAEIQNVVQVLGQVFKPGTGCWSYLPCP